MNTKLRLVAFLGLTLSLVVACSPAAPAAQPTAAPAKSEAAPKAAQPDSPEAAAQALYEAAKAEGELHAWVQMDAQQVAILAEAFQTRFPGVTVKPFEIRPEEAVSRLAAEAAAGGKVSADTLQTNLPTAQVLAQRNLSGSYNWGSLGTPADRIMGDNWGIAFFHASNPLAYNTSMVTAAEAPKAWEDLTEPEWDGKIVFEYRGLALSGLHPQWGEEKVLDVTQKIMNQNPIIQRGANTVLQAVIAGQAPIAIGALHYQVSAAIQQGAPIAFVPGLPATVRSIGTVPLNGPHPNAARLWTWWLGTQEGQAAVVKAQGAGLMTADADDPASQAVASAGIQLVILTAKQETAQGALAEKMEAIISQ